MELVNRFRATRLRHFVGKPTRSPLEQESVYATMFSEAARALALSLPPLYPVGGAANYSLLYILLRAFTELPIGAGVELGMGQSTLLLNALDARITSLDHEAEWVQRIGARVAHPAIHAPLREKLVRGHSTMVYDFDGGDYDFVLVDGPQGTKRRSRWGSLDILDRLKNEFLVVFDDVQRIGEQDTALAFLESRPNANAHLVHGSKTQCLIFTPKFGAAAFF